MKCLAFIAFMPYLYKTKSFKIVSARSNNFAKAFCAIFPKISDEPDILSVKLSITHTSNRTKIERNRFLCQQFFFRVSFLSFFPPCACTTENSGSSSCDEQSNQISSSPSPRTKAKRHQNKGRTKSIPATTSESIAIAPTTTVSGSSGGAGSQRSTLSSASFLLPKMQAEQGSIGELQKYHSRYLKNRRHTLANVR